MKKLIFKSADLLRVVEHSLAAPEQRPQVVDYNDDGPVYSAADAPAVLLVHDEGVYLMSNGKPSDPLGDGKGCYVAYAAGCNPKSDSDWYDTARDLVGGDDFSEQLPWAELIKAFIDAGEKEIIISMTSDGIELLTLRERH
jgi:hypothetical protein